MRRTLVGLTVVMLAILLLATPGLAEGPQAQGGMGPGHGQGTTVFAFQGCISGIDSDELTITVDIVKSKKGSEPPDVPILTDSNTRFFEWISEDTKITIDFDGLEVGDPVSVNGIETDAGPLATQVTVNPYCPALVDVCGQD